MYTLMETCLDRLDVFEFLSHVEDGLKDHYDIKVLDHVIYAVNVNFLTQMLTYLLLMRLSKLRANALLQRKCTVVLFRLCHCAVFRDGQVD